eukprot:TRINITY_DN81092_c0_g1_i1.p1 TRINITY_DN81092_c0_g1~~TRINITY_DN81092_c0_g1_i1.p1  ORF type:complete len:309 (+),score=57.49 TRINITY_DN81092_c0_g1_i1:76-927(+)
MTSPLATSPSNLEFDLTKRFVATNDAASEVEGKLMQELRLEREARQNAEAKLRSFAEGLHQTALGLVTSLEHRLDRFESTLEEDVRNRSAIRLELADCRGSTDALSLRCAQLEEELPKVQEELKRTATSAVEAQLAELSQNVSVLQRSSEQSGGHLQILLRSMQALQLSASARAAEVTQALNDLQASSNIDSSQQTAIHEPANNYNLGHRSASPLHRLQQQEQQDQVLLSTTPMHRMQQQQHQAYATASTGQIPAGYHLPEAVASQRNKSILSTTGSGQPINS